MSRMSGIQLARPKADRRKTTQCGPRRLPAGRVARAPGAAVWG